MRTFKAHPDPRFRVYRRADIPKDLHLDSNPREGDPVIVPNGPFTLRAPCCWLSRRRDESPWRPRLQSAHDAGDEGDLLCLAGLTFVQAFS